MTHEALIFELRWEPPRNSGPRITTARLMIRSGARAIWPVDGDDGVHLEIQADDLLSYLAEVWKPLLLRQTYPVVNQLQRPSQLRPEAERRWGDQTNETIERQDELITAFEEVHDLSRCFAGIFGLPPLWLFRQGDEMLIETNIHLRRVSFDVAWAALKKVGDEIAERLTNSGSSKWSRLIAAWFDRDKSNSQDLLAWTASLDRTVAASFLSENLLEAPKTFEEAANDNDELRIAARMASALPAEQIREIIALVRSFLPHPTPQLEELGKQVQLHINSGFHNERPFVQGEAAANFVRDRLKLSSELSVDIVAVLETLDVQWNAAAAQTDSLLALAVWGKRHGPAVYLNQSRFLQSPQTNIRDHSLARVTMAHELCHLLLDQGHAFTAVEVLQNRMPLNIEQRARAFAGQFLLPSKVAASYWKKAHRPRSLAELERLVMELCRDFGVTKSVAAWKLEHGTNDEEENFSTLLSAIAPSR